VIDHGVLLEGFDGDRSRTGKPTLDSDSPQAVLGFTAKMILSNDCSRTNKLMEGRNGRGLVVLDVEEAV
jgi:hypothetical protein